MGTYRCLKERWQYPVRQVILRIEKEPRSDPKAWVLCPISHHYMTRLQIQPQRVPSHAHIKHNKEERTMTMTQSISQQIFSTNYTIFQSPQELRQEKAGRREVRHERSFSNLNPSERGSKVIFFKHATQKCLQSVRFCTNLSEFLDWCLRPNVDP